LALVRRDNRVLVVRASRVHTLDEANPVAECVGMKDGRIVGTGSADELAALAGGDSEWLDVRPGVILPGFTDSHIHLSEWALGLDHPDLSGAGSMAGALAMVRQAAGAAPSEAWLEFKGWDPSWRSEASLEELDSAAAGRAVALIAHDLHSAWLSTEAMRRLGISRDRDDPFGGELERDEGGEPTGVLRERALDWWYQGRPEPAAAERRAAIREGQAHLHRHGVTGVHTVEGPVAFAAVERLSRDGELRLRVLHHFPQRFLDSLGECSIPSGFGDEWLRVGGVKYFTDGALGSQTAWMLAPYEGSRGRGIRRLEREAFDEDVRRAQATGLAATVHAIGDAAVRMTLDVLEAVGAVGLAVPHRIEHLQCVDPDDLARAARLGVVASMQPSHLLTDIPLIEKRWGRERGRYAFAFRSLLRAGTVLAFGSDAPVEAPDPREAFLAALTRQDRNGYPAAGWYPEERLSGMNVIAGYTVGAARAAGVAHRSGRLSPGYDADLAVWDTDLTTAAPEEIRAARVLATVVGGAVVYRA